MKEKVLKGRKRKRASKGQVIRVSDLVLTQLDKYRLNNRRLSYDAYLRQILGLPDRKAEAQWIKDGRPALLAEVFIDGFLLPGTRGGRFYVEEKDANGAVVELHARKAIPRPFKPVRVREVK